MWGCWALCPDLQEIVSGINGGKRGIEGKCGIGEKCITTVTLLKWFNIKPFKHTTLSMPTWLFTYPFYSPLFTWQSDSIGINLVFTHCLSFFFTHPPTPLSLFVGTKDIEDYGEWNCDFSKQFGYLLTISHSVIRFMVNRVVTRPPASCHYLLAIRIMVSGIVILQINSATYLPLNHSFFPLPSASRLVAY